MVTLCPFEMKLAPVKLLDVPLGVRLAAVRRAAREGMPKYERVSLFECAVFPSNKSYWLPKDSIASVKGVTNA